MTVTSYDIRRMGNDIILGVGVRRENGCIMTRSYSVPSEFLKPLCAAVTEAMLMPDKPAAILGYRVKLTGHHGPCEASFWERDTGEEDWTWSDEGTPLLTLEEKKRMMRKIRAFRKRFPIADYVPGWTLNDVKVVKVVKR